MVLFDKKSSYQVFFTFKVNEKNIFELVLIFLFWFDFDFWDRFLGFSRL
jgi:hypothetical protein